MRPWGVFTPPLSSRCLGASLHPGSVNLPPRTLPPPACRQGSIVRGVGPFSASLKPSTTQSNSSPVSEHSRTVFSSHYKSSLRLREAGGMGSWKTEHWRPPLCNSAAKPAPLMAWPRRRRARRVAHLHAFQGSMIYPQQQRLQASCAWKLEAPRKLSLWNLSWRTVKWCNKD